MKPTRTMLALAALLPLCGCAQETTTNQTDTATMNSTNKALVWHGVAPAELRAQDWGAGAGRRGVFPARNALFRALSCQNIPVEISARNLYGKSGISLVRTLIPGKLHNQPGRGVRADCAIFL